MIDYKTIQEAGESVEVGIKKYVRVNEDDWAGYGLPLDGNEILCELTAHFFNDGQCVANLICGGKHFYKKISNYSSSTQYVENTFNDYYNTYWVKIKDGITPEWFTKNGFEFW